MIFFRGTAGAVVFLAGIVLTLAFMVSRGNVFAPMTMIGGAILSGMAGVCSTVMTGRLRLVGLWSNWDGWRSFTVSG